MSSSTLSSAGAPSQLLKSELYRACLPQSANDPGRKLIWMNTLCLVFLTCGILGIAHPPGLILQQFSQEQEAPPVEIVQIKQQDQPPPEVSSQESEPTDEPQQQPVAVQPVVVAAANADVAFAVEVKGPVIISKDPNFSVPPPRVTQRSSGPAQTGPIRITGTGDGSGSFFPKPGPTDYPREALVRREQGSGEYLITVGAAGEIVETKVNASSGSPTLDNAFRQWIRKYYRFGPEYFGKQVLAPFEYRIR